MPKAPQIFASDEVSVFRRPKEYRVWFEEMLSRINMDRASRDSALRHIGQFKQFYEEVFPLAQLLRIKREAWSRAEFRNVFGSQPFDVEIANHYLSFLEITDSNFDDGEKLRMDIFLSEGAVDGIGAIERDSEGRAVGIEHAGAFRLHSDVINERVKRISLRIGQKSAKLYPPKTGLLVYCDDSSVPWSEEDRKELGNVLEKTRVDWGKKFEAVYLVGQRGDLFLERSTLTR